MVVDYILEVNDFCGDMFVERMRMTYGWNIRVLRQIVHNTEDPAVHFEGCFSG